MEKLKQIAETKFWEIYGRTYEDHEITQLEKDAFVAGFIFNNKSNDEKYSKEDVINILSDYIFDKTNVDEPQNVEQMMENSEKEAKKWFNENKK